MDIAVITGGSGFLGQHLVKYLQENCADEFSELRIADKHSFAKFLTYPDTIPINGYLVDCVEEQELMPVLQGARVVFNLAARPLCMNVYQDRERSYEDNVVSVKTLVKCMARQNVPYLVHCSDALVAIQAIDGQGLSELGTINLNPTATWLFGCYGETKYKGELVARRANTQLCDDATTSIRSIIIRPCLIYGEGDSLIVPHVLRLCRDYGSLLRVEEGLSQHQFVYAGNVAQLFALSYHNLKNDPENFGGEVFFCNEYERAINMYEYLKPFVLNAGYKLSTRNIPYVMAVWTAWLCEKFLRFFYSFAIKYDTNLPAAHHVMAVGGWNFHYNMQKLQSFMQFKPQFNPVKSMERTIDWWKDHSKDKNFV